VLRIYDLKGSYYEIGRQLGAILEITGGYPPKFSEETKCKARPYEEQVGNYAPDLLSEFRGIADELGIDYYIPITLETSPYRFNFGNCVVLAISGDHTASGQGVLVRNHEWLAKDSKNLRLCRTRPDGKLSSLGFTFHWPLVSRYGGINEAGLALSAASADFSTAGPGIMLTIAIRWILDNCEKTEDAVEFLDRMPKVWGETYVIIDRHNTIAKVESHANQTTTTYTESGFDFNTLLYDSQEMQPYLTKERINEVGELVDYRRVYLHKWFAENKGNISDGLLIQTISSHEHQLCNHDLPGLEICWSYLLKVNEKNALVCQGQPCSNKFVDVERP
jgi:hypothetical protein